MNLKKEIELHAKLNHRHIIKFFDAMQVDHTVFLLLEYASNFSLFHYIHPSQGLPERLALRFLYQTALAVEHLSKMNILHRDIKPENLLLNELLEIKLCDFGWSAMVEPNGRRSSICGTYEYMSPEILFSRGHGTKNEVWQLGILLHEMIYGTPPFKGKSVNSVKAKFQSTPIVYDSRMSPDTQEMMRRMLDSDEETRISISELVRHPVFVARKKEIEAPILREDLELMMSYFQLNTKGPFESLLKEIDNLLKGFSPAGNSTLTASAAPSNATPSDKPNSLKVVRIDASKYSVVQKEILKTVKIDQKKESLVSMKTNVSDNALPSSRSNFKTPEAVSPDKARQIPAKKETLSTSFKEKSEGVNLYASAQPTLLRVSEPPSRSFLEKSRLVHPVSASNLPMTTVASQVLFNPTPLASTASISFSPVNSARIPGEVSFNRTEPIESNEASFLKKQAPGLGAAEPSNCDQTSPFPNSPSPKVPVQNSTLSNQALVQPILVAQKNHFVVPSYLAMQKVGAFQPTVFGQSKDPQANLSFPAPKSSGPGQTLLNFKAAGTLASASALSPVLSARNFAGGAGPVDRRWGSQQASPDLSCSLHSLSAPGPLKHRLLGEKSFEGLLSGRDLHLESRARVIDASLKVDRPALPVLTQTLKAHEKRTYKISLADFLAPITSHQVPPSKDS